MARRVASMLRLLLRLHKERKHRVGPVAAGSPLINVPQREGSHCCTASASHATEAEVQKSSQPQQAHTLQLLHTALEPAAASGAAIITSSCRLPRHLQHAVL